MLFKLIKLYEQFFVHIIKQLSTIVKTITNLN